MEMCVENCGREVRVFHRCDTCYRRFRYHWDKDYRERRKEASRRHNIKRAMQAEKASGPNGGTHLPTQPLREWMQTHATYLIANYVTKCYDDANVYTLKHYYNISSSTWDKVWKEDFISLQSADTICGKLKVHFSEIWGNEWEYEGAA